MTTKLFTGCLICSKNLIFSSAANNFFYFKFHKIEKKELLLTEIFMTTAKSKCDPYFIKTTMLILFLLFYYELKLNFTHLE